MDQDRFPMNESKPKLGVYWAASCGGCDVSLLGIHEQILELVDAAEIAFWPAATDFKYQDLKNLSSNELTVTLFNGALRSSENEEMAHLLREKSEVLVGFGSCACQGGIPGLANLANREEIFDRAYLDNPTTSNPDGVVPAEEVELNGELVTLPKFYDRVSTLASKVEVDYQLPGCPPPPNLVQEFVSAFISGDMPEPGTVLGEQKTVCDQCDREWEKETIEEFRRPHEADIDGDRCLLDQGIICMGPATRGGCEARCPDANMPCTGCFGPPPRVKDQGTEMMNSLASILQTGPEEGNLDRERAILDQLPDPAGTFYRFSLPSSILGGRVEGDEPS